MTWRAWDALNHTEDELVPTMGQNTGQPTGRASVVFESAPSSPASEASTLDLNERDTQSSSNVNGTPTADESSQDIGPESRALRMCEMSLPKPYNWRLSEQQKQEATTRYEAGESCGKLAKDYGVSRQSMWDVLRRRTQMRDRIEALPRKERTAIREKRLRALRRYRSRAKRITTAQINAVWERDQVCQTCGGEGTDIDHILPVGKGGQTEMENLQLLCRACHHAKSRADWKGVSKKEASRLFMPYRTLQEDGTVEESFVEKDQTDALQGPSGNKMALLLTSSAEASRSCARTCPSPADEQDSQESVQDSSSSSHESLTLFSPMEAGSSLRTYPDYFPPTVDEISPSFSRRWPSSGFTTSPGECWTADTSECPSDGAGSSSLPDVLEADVHPRFYLSPRAAAGILRRAEKRGKPLPAQLQTALRQLAASPPQSDGTERQKISSLPSSLLAPTLSTKNEVASSSTQRAKWYEQAAEMWGTVRRLTPSECEALQGLPQGWTVVPSTPNQTDPATQPAEMR